MSERGVIIVGTGLITKFHAQAVNASSKLTLKGFVGRTKEKAAARAAEFGGEAFDDLDTAFSAPGVELAVVATASGAHDEAVFAAARHRSRMSSGPSKSNISPSSPTLKRAALTS